MAWFLETPATPQASTPNYGNPSTYSITNDSQEVVAAGSQSRYLSVSVASDASPIYVNYGAAVDVENGDYVYAIPAKLQHNKLEIPAQSIHMATASPGLTASIIIAVAG